MVAGIELPLVEFPVVIQSTRGKRQKALEEMLVPGFFPVSDQLLGMVRVLEIAVALKGAAVAGDEQLGVIEAQPVGIGFQGEELSGIAGRDGIAVGI
jgi:hypothetical protein